MLRSQRPRPQHGSPQVWWAFQAIRRILAQPNQKRNLVVIRDCSCHQNSSETSRHIRYARINLGQTAAFLIRPVLWLQIWPIDRVKSFDTCDFSGDCCGSTWLHCGHPAASAIAPKNGARLRVYPHFAAGS